jgi:hypothetical protein
VPAWSSLVIRARLRFTIPDGHIRAVGIRRRVAGTAGSVTLYVPAFTVNVFLPCSVSVSCRKAVALPPFTWKLKFVAIFVPPLSLITIFFTMSVPAGRRW